MFRSLHALVAPLLGLRKPIYSSTTNMDTKFGHELWQPATDPNSKSMYAETLRRLQLQLQNQQSQPLMYQQMHNANNVYDKWRGLAAPFKKYTPQDPAIEAVWDVYGKDPTPEQTVLVNGYAPAIATAMAGYGPLKVKPGRFIYPLDDTPHPFWDSFPS